jgi:CRP/FNR family cyclic AMP-dependent transcriptional regulator
MKSLWADLFAFRKKPQLTLLRALESSVLFETLAPDELASVSKLVYERQYLAGESIFRKEARGIGLYLITQGTVSIRTPTENSSPDDGDFEIARLETGSFFGELALIDPENIRNASAVALTHTTLVGFFKPDLEEILERRPEIGVKILLQLARVLGARLMRSSDELRQARKASPEVRTGATL